MRSSACDTLVRLCVRGVLCSTAFPLAPPLGSAGSATVDAVLFAGFIATMGESDFLPPCIEDFGLMAFSPRARLRCLADLQDIPVPRQGAYDHAGVSDRAEPAEGSHWRLRPYCLPPCSQRRRSEAYFRGSMASLNAPLSTLHGVPHEPPRMTRGRCRSLHVHRLGLSPQLPAGFAGARAITLSRKDWHSAAVGAVVSPSPGAEGAPRSCPAGCMATVGLRWCGVDAALTERRISMSKSVRKRSAAPYAAGGAAKAAQQGTVDPRGNKK